jgi:hypothetical protein
MKNLLLLGALFGSDLAAGEFINLELDHPDLTGTLVKLYPGGPLKGSVQDILPGWQITSDGIPLTTMTYSPPGSAGGQIPAELQASNGYVGVGNVLLLISSSFLSTQSPFGPELRLSQTGMIPADAIGLQMESVGFVQVYVNGTLASDLGNPFSASRRIDVAPFRGQSVKLEFVVAPGMGTAMDILGFTSVPEPSKWVLMGLGLAACAAMAKIGRRGQQ